MSGRMIAVRNVAVVLGLALAITVLPGGGNVTEAILTALSLAFIAAIGLLIGRFWQQQGLTLDVMTDRDRAILYASLAALVLMVAGIDELLDSGGGTLLFLAVTGGAVYGVFTAWRNASTY